MSQHDAPSGEQTTMLDNIGRAFTCYLPYASQNNSGKVNVQRLCVFSAGRCSTECNCNGSMRWNAGCFPQKATLHWPGLSSRRSQLRFNAEFFVEALNASGPHASQLSPGALVTHMEIWFFGQSHSRLECLRKNLDISKSAAGAGSLPTSACNSLW